jgi:sodium-coupled neutral amino acid transporter 11
MTLYSLLGDAFAELFKAASLPKVIASRNGALVLITATILAPLCSLQSLHALYPFSVAGLIGTFLTAAVMAVRFFDGTYQLPSVPTPGTSAAMSGLTFITIPRLNKLLASSSASLVFVSAISDFLTRRSFVLLSMLSTAFVAHYHAPRLYNELKDRNTSRFNTVVYTGFSISTALYVLMMSVGYLTFGGSSQGFILNNYATNDRLASIARAAVGLSLITGYPLIFFALRDSLLDLLSQREAVYKSLSTTRSVSTGLLVLLTAVSMMLKDVGLVVSLTGALCGCTLMFVFPAFMSIKSNSARRTQLYADQLNLEYSVKSRFSSPAVLPDPIRQEVARIRSLINRSYISSGTSLAMITTGVLMAALGVYVSLAKELGIGL